MESIFLFGGFVPAKTRVQPNAFTLGLSRQKYHTGSRPLNTLVYKKT
jgi:hypothetical protein